LNYQRIVKHLTGFEPAVSNPQSWCFSESAPSTAPVPSLFSRIDTLENYVRPAPGFLPFECVPFDRLSYRCQNVATTDVAWG